MCGGRVSEQSLRSWVERIQGMLQFIDSGGGLFPKYPPNTWKAVSTVALQGRLDNAIQDARAMFARRDPGEETEHNALQAYGLATYTALVIALRHHRNPPVILDVLIENLSFLRNYLADFSSSSWPDEDFARAVKVFTFKSLDSIADIEDPIRCLQDRVHLWNRDSLSMAGSLLFSQFFPDPPTTPSPEHRPNIVHYTTVIAAFSQVGDLDGVSTWLVKLSRQGLRPDFYVYSTILHTLSMRGDLKSMSSLLDQMRSSGI